MTVLMREVALVSEIGEITASELTRVAAALQEQATRDFGPLWDVQAAVNAFTRLEDVPLSAWPMLVETDIQQSGAAGVHLDRNGQPYALIQYDPAWALTASHECLEMLADPFGNRLQEGPSPVRRQGLVRFLVEVCDPCEGADFAYQINEVTVSDFITPHFYDPVTASGVRYSYTGAIKAPRQVLNDGYISWQDPTTQHWYQLTYFNGQRRIRDLGPLGREVRSIREAIDSVTPSPLVAGAPGRERVLAAARPAQPADATVARARTLREDISQVKANAAVVKQQMFPRAQEPTEAEDG